MSLSFLVLWVVTVFFGSGLLFIAQPVVAKMLLPRLGGAPAVWTTSVLFFQAVLLLGYGYAHWLGRRSRGTQIAIHAALLLAPLGLLPFRLIDGAPAGGPLAPALWLFEALVLAVGAPLFVLSASTPLLQKWLSHTRLAPSRDPYFLYAASNAGSLLVLFAYPLLVEPVIGDARLTLSSAQGPFDVLVLDAFTSGAIPVHLLTREAFDLYEDKLAPDGVLAFHISNRHLDLAPLVRAMAKDRGLAAVIEDGAPGSARPSQELGSRWAFLARSSEALRARGFPPEGVDSSPGLGRVWTDDRSDLWSLFLW